MPIAVMYYLACLNQLTCSTLDCQVKKQAFGGKPTDKVRKHSNVKKEPRDTPNNRTKDILFWGSVIALEHKSIQKVVKALFRVR